MTDISFRGWSLACDPAVTGRAHANAGVPGAELCSCDTCLNFAIARHTLYDPPTRALLRQLNVPDLRESHVTDLGPTQPGLRLYIVLFHFVGEIRACPDAPAEDITFRPRTYPLPPSFADLPVIEMSISEDVKLSRNPPETTGNRRHPVPCRITSGFQHAGVGSEILSSVPDVRVADFASLPGAGQRFHAGTAIR